MPTGYTDKLYEGKSQTFPEFAMSCARAFGALITMRDEPMDAPIPDEFVPSSYHVEALEAARRERERITRMTVAEVCAHQDNAISDAEKRRAEYIAKRDEIRERYGQMLAQVHAWDYPTGEHKGLKEFMVSQLEESIRFDCGGSYVPEVPERLHHFEYKGRLLDKADRDIAYHEKHLREERERAESRTAWVRALRDSLEAERVG